VNVAMVIRPDAGLRPGGDVVQAEKTAEALRRTGVRVRLGSGEGMSDADVVHIFNLQTPAWTLAQVRAAQRLHKPIVLSPVYWNWHRLLLGAAAQFPRVLPHLLAAGTARTARGVHPRVTPLLPLGQRRDLRAIVNGCHLLLPNSSVEGDLLRAEFPELRKRMDAMPVVPNGVDVQAWERNKSQSRVVDELGVPDEYALCVARIEFRKNQLWLIRAAAQLRLPLVLVGDPVQSSFWHRAYYQACKAARKPVIFLGHRPQETLWPLYARCKVHCLPSYFETPGLSNLEAALAGTRLVTTAYGSTQEYFGRWATYCEPTSVRSIAHAIVRTLESAPPGELQRVVRERYDWTRVAEATSRAYVLALEREGAAGSTFSTAS